MKTKIKETTYRPSQYVHQISLKKSKKYTEKQAQHKNVDNAIEKEKKKIKINILSDKIYTQNINQEKRELNLECKQNWQE